MKRLECAGDVRELIKISSSFSSFTFALIVLLWWLCFGSFGSLTFEVICRDLPLSLPFSSVTRRVLLIAFRSSRFTHRCRSYTFHNSLIPLRISFASPLHISFAS